MQLRLMWHVAFLVAVAMAVPLASARAADKYQCTLVQEGPALNTTDFKLTKPGNKIKITPAPAKTPGTGLVFQLILMNVDCPAEGNDKGMIGKCGVAATKTTLAAPVDAVLDVSLHAGGLDLPHFAGIPIEFTKGTAVFSANEKNKIDGLSALGALSIGTFLTQPIGFSVLTIRTEGTDPTNPTTGCGVIPLPPLNTCLDGIPFAFTGVTASP